MFSQQVINEYVSLNIICGLVFAVVALGIFAYYWIDYLLFCRRLRKSCKLQQRKQNNGKDQT